MSAHPPQLPLFARAREHANRTALVAPEGAFTYAELLDASARVAAALLDGRTDLREARVAFLPPPGWDYVAVQWGVWCAGGIAVPLAVSHPRPSWRTWYRMRTRRSSRTLTGSTHVIDQDVASAMRGAITLLSSSGRP